MSRRLPAAPAALALAAAALLLAGCGGGNSADAVATTVKDATTDTVATATKGRSFVVYAKPTQAQFISHADDRERGNIKNPFDPDLLPTPPKANSGKKGARAGDDALFSFKLYSDPKLTRPVGSAIYSCKFNFAQEAICEANFALTGGTMIAMGPAQLDSSDIVLPVTGGTGRYAGAHGQFASRSSGNATNTQIIRFRLL